MLLHFKITPGMKTTKYYAEKYVLCYWTRFFKRGYGKSFRLARFGLMRGFQNGTLVQIGLCWYYVSLKYPGFLLWETLKKNFGGEVVCDPEA
jgi:hypothetical protein